MINIDEIIESIKCEEKNKGRVVIGIDGRCGAGKTTLSKELVSALGGEIIHMDDFYIPKELRVKERLSEPGGNVHYERFNQEVAGNIRTNKDIHYRIFSCKTMSFVDSITVKADTKIIIVEGSYSLHPMFRDIYDIKIFCNIDNETQKERIIKRNGKEAYKGFEAKWIPMEEEYFNCFKIQDICSFKVDPKI